MNDRLWRLGDRWWYGLIGGLAVLYVGLTLAAPTHEAQVRYGLSALAVYLLELTIVLPVVAVWLSAAYGSLQFKAYAARIHDSRDGQALALVARGLLVLVAGLAATTMMPAAVPFLHASGWVPAWTVIGNILEAVWPLVAFWLIYQGSQRLMAMIKRRPRWRRSWLMLLLAPIVAIYTWLLLHHPYRAGSPDPVELPAFYMPDLGLIIFLVLPYALTWYLGLVTALQIRHYHRHAGGVIYRRALVWLTAGLVAVIGSSLLIQMVTVLVPNLQGVGLGAILGLLYVLIGVYASGHLMILAAARRLSRIEQAV